MCTPASFSIGRVDQFAEFEVNKTKSPLHISFAFFFDIFHILPVPHIVFICFKLYELDGYE